MAGLAAAWQLAQRGWEVEVHEAAPTLGGLLAPVPFRGVDCDVGSHRLHPQALSEPLLRALADHVHLEPRRRAGRILLGGRALAYPLGLPGLLAGLGPSRALRCTADLLRQRVPFAAWEAERQSATGEDVGFAAFVLSRAGPTAYHAFYAPYARKVWGLEPAELSQTAAKQRVSTSQPLQALLTRQSPTFLYPRGGMAALIGALERLARAAGVRIHLGQPLDLAQVDADAIVHSGHLGDVVGGRDVFAHRGLYLLHLAIPRANLGHVDTWYAPEAQWWFGRVTNLRQFDPQAGAADETVLCCEIPEGAWGPHHDFAPQIPALIAQLHAAGILSPGVQPVAVSQRFVPAVYPLYRRGWVKEWRQALRDLAQRDPRILPVGRQGLYLHCNVDHALMTARLAVAHLDAGGNGESWRVQAESFVGLQVRD